MVNPEINLPADFSKGEETDLINTPHDGYCYHLSNDQGLRMRPKTKIIYMPFLDMVPTNSTTIQTSMN